MKSMLFKWMLSALAMTSILGMGTAQNNKTTDEAERNGIVYRMGNNSFTVDNIEIYHTKTQEDFNKVTEVLQNRKRKIIVEIITGTVLDDSGNGVSAS